MLMFVSVGRACRREKVTGFWDNLAFMNRSATTWRVGFAESGNWLSPATARLRANQLKSEHRCETPNTLLIGVCRDQGRAILTKSIRKLQEHS
jgi:hypothetical protein